MRITNRLTEKQVRNAKPGKGNFLARLLDGGGLYLQATNSKTGGVNRNWVFRYERNGKRRDMGLGSLHASVSRPPARRPRNCASGLSLKALTRWKPGMMSGQNTGPCARRRQERRPLENASRCISVFTRANGRTASTPNNGGRAFRRTPIRSWAASTSPTSMRRTWCECCNRSGRRFPRRRGACAVASRPF